MESSEGAVSGYLVCVTAGVLCAGQGFAVRKDMDHFSQLIHYMYTARPRQSVKQFAPVPKRQECFSFV